MHVDYLGRFPVGVVRSGGCILAFGSLIGSADKAELSIEFVRYVANMPTGILDLVLVEAILWTKGQGYRTVNLGSTPPRGLGLGIRCHAGTGLALSSTVTENSVPLSHHGALDAHADAAQSEGPHGWDRINRLADQWLPKPRILHPWPNQRFAVNTSKVGAGCGNVARPVLAGGAQ